MLKFYIILLNVAEQLPVHPSDTSSLCSTYRYRQSVGLYTILATGIYTISKYSKA